MSKTRSLVFGVTPGKYPKKGKASPVDVMDAAVWNEYGTETIPPRPAFRMGVEHALNVNRRMIQAQLKNLVRRVLTGREDDADWSLTILLTQIGKSAKAETVRIIKTGTAEPRNAPATTAKKGFDHPLYETGLLLEHVDYEVKE